MSDKKITLGLIQMEHSSDAAANLDKALKNIEKCAVNGARLICLSELFLSRYFCQGKNKKYFAQAETIPGPTTKILSAVAAKKGVAIVASLFEKAPGGKFYNSTVVIGDNGKILSKYRKIHIPSLPPGLYDESYYFASGNLGLPVAKSGGVKISAPICYDQWFPEVARVLASKGAEIIFYPTAIGWPQGDKSGVRQAEHEAWQTVQRAHAIENSVFVAAVNRVGKEGDLTFWGSSFVSDPYGRVIAQAPADKECNLIVDCDLSLIDSMKREWMFLKERKLFISGLIPSRLRRGIK